jgi:DNA gyrase/topoisomerase IV subunit A
VKQGFLTGQGNFGSNVGVESTGAAAPRYTQCRLNTRTLELAFKYIKYVDWVDTELEDREPLYLPTMYPICLLGNEPTQGIGFGYKTYIPCYKVEDLHKRLLWILGIRKRKPIIAPITDCNITSTPEELDELLTTGKAKISVEGIIDINQRNNTVTLRSWPPGKRFESLLNKFSKELSEGLIGHRDASSTETEIIFTVMRERNRDKIFNEFIERLKEVIKGIISFETIVVDIDHKVVHRSIDDMLTNTFTEYMNVNKRMLTEEKDRILSLIQEYLALEVIRQPLSDCLKLGYDIEATLDEITKATAVQREVAHELIKKYRIMKLLTLNTDTTELNNQLKEIDNKLKRMSEFVLNQYGGFK